MDGSGKSRERLVIMGGRSHPEFVRNLCRSLDHPVARQTDELQPQRRRVQPGP